AGAKHRVYGIDAAHRRVLALCALRAGVIEVERKRNYLSLFNQPRRRDDVFGSRVVERADFVVGTPLAPVFVFFRSCTEILSGEFAGGHRASFQRDGVGKRRNDRNLFWGVGIW